MTLYLAVADAKGVVIPGDAVPARLASPFRSGAVVNPFTLATANHGAERPLATGGVPAGRVALDELVVTTPADASGAALFQALVQNQTLAYADLLVTEPSEKGEVVVAGLSVATAIVAAVRWAYADGALVRTLRLDGRVFTVCSSTRKANGAIAYALFGYDTSTGA